MLEHSRALLSSLSCSHMNLTNTCISIYRKAALSPGHAAFLILHNNKQSLHHPIFEHFSSSFQSMFRDLISDIGGRSYRDIFKASCCQVILYILHFPRFPILISKINFSISAFGNFLRNVHLNSILIIPHILPNQYSWQLFSDKPGKIILNFFSCRKISNILPMQNPHNTFLLIFFISDLIRDEKYVYYYLHIFHLL